MMQRLNNEINKVPAHEERVKELLDQTFDALDDILEALVEL